MSLPKAEEQEVESSEKLGLWVKELQAEGSRVWLPWGVPSWRHFYTSMGMNRRSTGSSQGPCRDETRNLALHQKKERQSFCLIMGQIKEVTNYQGQSISPSPAIQSKAVLTSPHLLQTHAERGSKKDLT